LTAFSSLIFFSHFSILWLNICLSRSISNPAYILTDEGLILTLNQIIPFAADGDGSGNCNRTTRNQGRCWGKPLRLPCLSRTLIY
jgi:hypothetical protein